MLSEAMTALAAAGGTAVVQAAGTDAWAGVRQQVARWFGRGDQRRENAELERLDQTAGELATAGPSEVERVRVRQEAAWQVRIETLLEGLEDNKREQVSDELRTVLAPRVPDSGVSAGQGGLAVGGDVKVQADHGSAAAVTMGTVHVGNPPRPGPHQD
ncbi:hypothetical protein ACFYVL_07485 [Streptomyces sp. NPDC004111]|uniref:hypothetical protein n=1 Tax=Streptomyces sp. NPDC004111 TaxID=3364690 RepID=UPI00368C8E67